MKKVIKVFLAVLMVGLFVYGVLGIFGEAVVHGSFLTPLLAISVIECLNSFACAGKKKLAFLRFLQFSFATFSIVGIALLFIPVSETIDNMLLLISALSLVIISCILLMRRKETKQSSRTGD